MMTAMLYALTGATGFLGSVLTRQLLDAGHDVVALVRSPDKAAHLREQGVALVPGDLDDAAALDTLLSGADGFFHVAGWYKLGRRQHELLRHVNIDGTRNALEAAKRAGTPRTVYTSTVALNSDTGGEVVDESYRFTGEHVSEYDRTKGVAHDIAEEFAAQGLPLVIVQPGIIYGPDDTGSAPGQMMQQLLAGKTVMGPAKAGGSWGHVEDVARGHILAMERGTPGESYYLTGPTATFRDVMGVVVDKAGRGRYLATPNAMITASIPFFGLLERIVDVPQSFTAEGAKAGRCTYYGDGGKARSELGWEPRPIEQGIAETVAAELGAGGA